MSITADEKEALFAEFELRFKERKQGYASSYETIHNMEQAKDYFWTRYNNITKKYENVIKKYNYPIQSRKTVRNADWVMIRKLVCHANGVSIVREISPEKLTDANELAIRILELLFDYNEHILDEEDGAV